MILSKAGLQNSPAIEIFRSNSLQLEHQVIFCRFGDGIISKEGASSMKNSPVFLKIMKSVLALVGLMNRALVRVPGVGKKMVASTSRSLGKVAPRAGFLGFRKEPSYDNTVYNWEIFLDLIGAEYEKEEVSPQRITYTFHKCPAGYCQPGHLDACEATMELDRTFVEKSGAHLIVEKRIPIDGVCVETLISGEDAD
jgi:hypothetical protein